MNRLRHMMRALRRDERGAAIIELAFIAPIFALGIIGVVDMSNAYSRKLALEQGAQRAIEKIMQTTGDDTVEGTLKTEVVCQVNGTNSDGSCKSSPITTDNVTVSDRLECTDGAGALTVKTGVDAADDCDPGSTQARYISVHVTDEYTPMFSIHFSALDSTDSTYHISATAGMRTE